MVYDGRLETSNSRTICLPEVHDFWPQYQNTSLIEIIQLSKLNPISTASISKIAIGCISCLGPPQFQYSAHLRLLTLLFTVYCNNMLIVIQVER